MVVGRSGGGGFGKILRKRFAMSVPLLTLPCVVP